jgi:hypothetical protein
MRLLLKNTFKRRLWKHGLDWKKNLGWILKFLESSKLSLPVISDWLAWKIGNGKAVRLGVDPMVGCHNFYKLSTNLILALKEQGVTSWHRLERVMWKTLLIIVGNRLKF